MSLLLRKLSAANQPGDFDCVSPAYKPLTVTVLVFFFFRGHVVLMPDFSLPLEYYLIPFLIIVGICLILIVVFMVDKDVSVSTQIPRPA